jgi:hypothetical protein
MRNGVLLGVVAVVGVFVLYQYDPTLFGLLPYSERFTNAPAGTGKKAGVNELAYTPSTASNGSTQSSPGQTTKQPNVSNGNPVNEPSANKGTMANDYSGKDPAVAPTKVASKKGNNGEGFADLASMEGPANFASVEAPAGCYPRDQLTPAELLPYNQDTIYAQQNPMGPGSLKAKNFLSAGSLIGVNTTSSSLRNASHDLRSEPPNPQVPVSIFLQSTIQPDISRKPLEIGS